MQIIPLIQNCQAGPWVNVFVLMQIVMITVSSYGGPAVTETGGTGHGWLMNLVSSCSEKGTFWYFVHGNDVELVCSHSLG